jgi:hypothetical protein
MLYLNTYAHTYGDFSHKVFRKFQHTTRDLPNALLAQHSHERVSAAQWNTGSGPVSILKEHYAQA